VRERVFRKESLVKSFLQITVMTLGIAVLIPGGCGKKAEEKASYEIRTKTTERMTLIYLKHTGPYDQMGEVFARLAEYATKKELTGDVVGIYYDDPAQVPAEELRSEIGLVAREGTVPDSGYSMQVVPAQKVVYTILKGPYDEIAKEYPYMMQWIEENGYEASGPLMEIYLEAGPDIPQEQLVTEVRIPIKE
jgi:AraC family transcriptional regulator